MAVERYSRISIGMTLLDATSWGQAASGAQRSPQQPKGNAKMVIQLRFSIGSRVTKTD